MDYKESFNDTELNKDLSDYLQIFRKTYVKSDWKNFKKRADEFFKDAKKIKGTPICVTGRISERIRNSMHSRIFMGIGMELLLKSIYLKNGFLINTVNVSSLKEKKCHKNKSKPFKIKEIPKKYIDTSKTQTLGTLLKHLKLVQNFGLDNNHFNSDIFMGLRIMEAWRNKDAHVGGGYHREDSGCWYYTQEAIKNLYKIVFDEDFTI